MNIPVLESFLENGKKSPGGVCHGLQNLLQISVP